MASHVPREELIGKVFERKYRGAPYIMEVVSTDFGVGYKVLDEVYKSPTAAAKAVVGKDQYISGPKFWKLD